MFNTLLMSGQIKSLEVASRMITLFHEIEAAFYDAEELRKSKMNNDSEMPT